MTNNEYTMSLGAHLLLLYDPVNAWRSLDGPHCALCRRPCIRALLMGPPLWMCCDSKASSPASKLTLACRCVSHMLTMPDEAHVVRMRCMHDRHSCDQCSTQPFCRSLFWHTHAFCGEGRISCAILEAWCLILFLALPCTGS